MKRTSLSLVLASVLAAGAAQATENPVLSDGSSPQQAASASSDGAPRVSSPIVPSVTEQERDYYQREAELAQQKRLLDLQLEIHEREQRLAGVGSSRPAAARPEPTVISRVPADGATSPKPAPAARPAAHSSAGLPFRVVSIWGPDDALQAQVYSHGLRITVREGDSLPEGWVVRKVARTGLIIARGRTERTVVIGG